METITIDPVCGMDVEDSSPHRAEYKGTLYLFCSDGCRQKFERDPERWIRSATKNEHHSTSPARGAGSEKVRQKGRGTKWSDYIPLMVIIVITLLAACAKQYAYLAGSGWNWMSWMHDFMGFFLVVFSMFKFFNLEGFADGFQMYDLLAKPFRPYAYLYPFIELGIGLGYLSHWQPAAIYSATFIVMAFGALGVIRALTTRLDIECACLGTVLSVPLSTVAMIEDLGMAGMAAAMLIAAILKS
jgi:YHS domain-containing protein